MGSRDGVRPLPFTISSKHGFHSLNSALFPLLGHILYFALLPTQSDLRGTNRQPCKMLTAYRKRSDSEKKKYFDWIY
jgi:hypothetical protein